MKNSNNFASYVLDAVGAIFTASQSDDVLRWISLALTILATLVSLAFTIWKWWLKAKEDGKISKDEIDELADDVAKGIDDTKKAVDDAKKDEK